MTKKLFFLLVISSTFIYAQDGNDTPKGNQTLFGVRAGGSLSFSDLIGTDDNSNIAGYYVGVFSETTFNSKWSLRTELTFSVDDASFLKGSDTEIETSFLVKYRLAEKFSMLLGPQIDIGTPGNGQLELSGVLGLQYDVSDKFFIEARYNYDLSRRPIPRISQFKSEDAFKIGVGFKF